MKSIKLPLWSKRLFGLNPVRVPPFVFSVDDGALNYFSLAEGEALACQEAASVELSDECFHAGPLGGRLKDVESFTRGLDALLGKLIQRPSRASLVVPDDWLRLTFAEVDEWPRKRAEQLDILRFKLSKIVPFRVEELRVGAQRVPALTAGSEYRFLVGFGIDSAFAQLEQVFLERGIRIGDISNTSLSLLEGLKPSLEPAPLGALVSVARDRYALVVTRHGDPVVYRSKAHGLDEALTPVARELRLTLSFLRERVEPGILTHLILVASEAREAAWQAELEEVFGIPATVLTREWRAIPGLSNLTAQAAAPLLGAALREVA